MKGIIMDIEHNEMVLLTNQGDFIKRKYIAGRNIGDEVNVVAELPIFSAHRYAALAASVILCMFLSSGVYAYFVPSSYVSIDVNPSVELVVNRFEKVIDYVPLNNDAVNLNVKESEVKYKDVRNAICVVLDDIKTSGYITANENAVILVVSSSNASKAAELKSNVTSVFSDAVLLGPTAEVMVEQISLEKHLDSFNKHVSPGKAILQEYPQAPGETALSEDMDKISVKEVIHVINERKAYKKEKDRDKDKDKDKVEDSDKSEDNNKDKIEGKDQNRDKAEDKDQSKNRIDSKDQNRDKVEDKDQDKNKIDSKDQNRDRVEDKDQDKSKIDSKDQNRDNPDYNDKDSDKDREYEDK